MWLNVAVMYDGLIAQALGFAGMDEKGCFRRSLAEEAFVAASRYSVSDPESSCA